MISKITQKLRLFHVLCHIRIYVPLHFIVIMDWIQITIELLFASCLVTVVSTVLKRSLSLSLGNSNAAMPPVARAPLR